MSTLTAPVEARARINSIDILRGAALLGILYANMRGFVAPASVYFNTDLLWDKGAEWWAQTLEFLFVQGKFISLFAMLFGLGFAVQFGRAKESGRSLAFYPRRLAILALFGFIHAVFIWWGDILWDYAIFGFVLFLFRNRSQKFVLRAAIVIAICQLLMPFGFYAWNRMHPPAQTAQKDAKPKPKPGPSNLPPDVKKDIETLGCLNYPAIVKLQFGEWFEGLQRLPFMFLLLMPRFLFGMWVWRSGFFKDLPGYARQIKRVWLGALAVAVTATLAVMLIFPLINRNGPSPWNATVQLCIQTGAYGFALFYATSLLRALNSDFAPKLLPFAAVGRMALTNYLMQTFCMTWIFRLTGLYAKIGPLEVILPCLAFYTAQLLFSNWWLARYQFGPMEWLWRSLTYGSMQPMRKPATPPSDQAIAAMA